MASFSEHNRVRIRIVRATGMDLPVICIAKTSIRATATVFVQVTAVAHVSCLSTDRFAIEQALS